MSAISAQGGTTARGATRRNDERIVQAISPLSSDPQPQIDDGLEFELKEPPTEAQEQEVFDLDDDLAIPLEPWSERFLQENFPIPEGVVEVDPSDFNVPALVEHYGYKFSDTVGKPKQRALLVGIKGTELKGPHNDVEDMKRLLIDNYNWPERNIMMLKDEDSHSIYYPTQRVVFDHLFMLVHEAQPGDHLFMHCEIIIVKEYADPRLVAGHGSQIQDLDGDEADGLDEVICCADGKIIVDDQLHDILVKPLPKGCSLVAVFDCCSSGTGLDLVRTPMGTTPSASPRIANREVRELQFNATFASGALDLPHSFSAKEAAPDGTVNVVPIETKGRKKHSDGDVVMWSACQDSASSHEIVTNEGVNKGALSHAFMMSLRHTPEQTYRQLLQSIEHLFERWEVHQTPQLNSSHKLDRDGSFRI